MSSAQQQVLTALQVLLAAGGTVAGARVYLDQADPLAADQLPAILIEEADGETAEAIFMDGGQQRETNVTLHCVLTHTSTAAADARAFGLAVEKLIVGSASFVSLCRLGLELKESRTTINGDGDRLMATRTQIWRCAYHVHPLNPDIINP